MSDWKVLKVDNLPSDILTGDYEFETIENGDIFTNKCCDVLHVIKMSRDKIYSYRYRKIQPEAPTHEDIMTKWFKDSDQTCSDHMNPTWLKVVQYVPDAVNCYVISGQRRTRQIDKQWFIGKESADIPPARDE